MKKIIFISYLIQILLGCSTVDSNFENNNYEKKIIDGSENVPKWVNESKLSWEEGKYLYYKGF